MKRFRQNSFDKLHGLTEVLLILLIIGGVTAGGFLGCGKLSDDTNRPSSPVGTSGGIPVPIAPSASLGTYTISISADPTSIPADGVNFTTLHAYLDDSSGRPLAGYQILFEADTNGTFSTNTGSTGFTDADGHASVRLLGLQSGSCVVQATADLDDDGTADDLVARTTVTFTPGGTPSSAGTYSLGVIALPSTIPADLATSSTIIAMLRDSSGGSVENFTINFYTEVGGSYGSGYLWNEPTGFTGTSNTAIDGTTNALGDSSVYFYGAQEGSALVQACVTVPDLVGTLCDTVWITITEGPGEPGPEIAGIRLTVDSSAKTSDAGDCADLSEATTDFEFTTRVWDETGDLVGAGVRVELLPEDTDDDAINGTDYNLQNDYTTDSAGTVTFSRTYTTSSTGTYNYYLKAAVTINGRTYTDRVFYTWTVTCDVADPDPLTIEVVIEPTEITTTGSSIISALVTSDGAAVSGATVTFTHNQGLGTLSLSSATTGSNGLAVTTFTAYSTAGTATIYVSAATTDASGSSTETITIIDAPASVVASAPTRTLTMGASTSTSGDLTATAVVTNASGGFIEGTAVGFSLVTTGGDCTAITFSPTSGAGTTNVAGIAEFQTTVTATAVTTGCNYQITTSAGTQSDTASGTIRVN